MKKLFALGVILTLLAGTTGCSVMQSGTGKGAVYGTAGGAAAGALLGQAIGGNTKATLLGAAAGALIGGIGGSGVGYMMDKQEQDMRNALAQSEAIAIQREGDVLALTFSSDITFGVNSASIQPGLNRELARVAQVLNKYPDTTLTVAGYTDSSGAEAYNQTLSEKRANAVKDALVKLGVDAARIYAVGYGEEYPVADNATAEGRQMNRRVEVSINPADQPQQ